MKKQKKIYKEKGILDIVKNEFVSIAFFLVILCFIIFGVNNIGSGNSKKEIEIAKESINRAIVTCYAVEGTYPTNFEYIKKNYGIHVNEKKYIVHYEIFASNIFPDVTIIER